MSIEDVWNANKDDFHTEREWFELGAMARNEEIATLQRELEQERKRAAERDDYIKSMDAIWEEYIEKQLPGFEHLVEFLTDPANAEAIAAAIAQAEGGRE